jgi:cysteinyl-tRNA synthetase
LLTKEGRKISKSDPGTIVLMSDLLRSYSADTIRVLLLSSHYRRPIDYGAGRLDEIERGLQTFYRAFERFEELTGERFDRIEAAKTAGAFDPGESPLLKEVAEHRQGFLDAMNDDFNTGGALGELFEIVHVLNRAAHAAATTPGAATDLTDYRTGMMVLRELSLILGLFRSLPERDSGAADVLTGPLLELLIDLRNRLRKEKQFAIADEIRNRLTGLGVTLEDKPDGTRWRIESKP